MAEVKMPKDNSNKARLDAAVPKPTETPVVPVTPQGNGMGAMRKKPLVMKFADTFFEGNVKNALRFMLYDIAIPQAKSMFLKGFEILLFNKASGTSYNSGGYPYANGYGYTAPQTSYGSYYIGRDGQRRDSGQKASPAAVAKIQKVNDPRLIILQEEKGATRSDAEMVLEDLRAECAEYGQVSVARLFNHPKVGISSDWGMTNYGWKKGMLDFPRASVVSCPGGWSFDLPDPVPID